jgi:hypothetical protein
MKITPEVIEDIRTSLMAAGVAQSDLAEAAQGVLLLAQAGTVDVSD